MTLGEIIKKYTEDHSVTQFIKDSGLSKAYVYMLIANKNNKGEPITPSLDTIRKVADGMHVSFEDIFNQLDYDFVIHLGEGADSDPKEHYIDEHTAHIAQEIFENSDLRVLFDAARDSRPEDLKMAAEMLKRFKETNTDG